MAQAIAQIQEQSTQDCMLSNTKGEVIRQEINIDWIAALLGLDAVDPRIIQLNECFTCMVDFLDTGYEVLLFDSSEDLEITSIPKIFSNPIEAIRNAYEIANNRLEMAA